MNYEILKSESYQKILKTVLKLRYPELSYEEALVREIQEYNCLVSIDLSKLGYLMHTGAPLRVVSQTKYEFLCIEPIYGKLFGVYDKNSKRILNKAEVLGRPITLCELVDVLNDNIEDEENIDEYGYYYHLNAIYKMGYVISYTGTTAFLPKKQIEFQKNTYHLHEQPQAVLDEIIKLLK